MAGCLGNDLVHLAGLDGASGDESRVIEYVQSQFEGRQRIDANGSLVVTFGSGPPRTLLVAGVDEPGLAVSGIHPDGYLYLRPLAEGTFAPDLASHFPGQHVNVSTGAGTTLHGVVPVPSVHFRPRSRSPVSSDGLLVDIGARNRREATAAGVALLDRVTLHKRPAFLADGSVAAPWISSRSGAAVLMALGRRLRSVPVSGTVSLAFATQQQFHSAGVGRVVASFPGDRVVVLMPGDGPASSVSAVSGADPSLADELAELGERQEVPLDRGPRQTFSFGPFARGVPWDSDRPVAVIRPAVRNPNTPAEAVRPGEIEQLSLMLGTLIGLSPPTSKLSATTPGTRESTTNRSSDIGRTSPLERTVRQLVEVPGVSGHEGAVRDLLTELLPPSEPDWYVTRSDEKGNLIVKLGTTGEPSSMFLAHMDEIGYVVRNIASGGSVSADSRGGGSPRLFAWRRVAVHGSYGTLPAVMRFAGTLDLGGSSAETIRGLGVQVDDAVTVPKLFRRLLGTRVSARSLDDRLGCAVLVEAVRRLVPRARRFPGSIEFVFTVEEETGLNGARHLAESSRPRRVYAVDTFVTSDSPLESATFAFAPLGHGPVLRALDESGMTPRSEIDRVAILAQRHGIPLQSGATAGGNDGSVFRSIDTVNIPIGFPLRYAHSPVETADLADAEAAVDLIEVLAIEELRRR